MYVWRTWLSLLFSNLLIIYAHSKTFLCGKNPVCPHFLRIVYKYMEKQMLFSSIIRKIGRYQRRWLTKENFKRKLCFGWLTFYRWSNLLLISFTFYKIIVCKHYNFIYVCIVLITHCTKRSQCWGSEHWDEVEI